MEQLNRMIEDEAIQRLANEYPKLYAALQDPRVFTKAGRVNMSALARLMKMHSMKVLEMFNDMQRRIGA